MIIPFLNVAKEYFQENVLNTELIYAYAKNSKVTDLEKIVNGPNVVNIQGIGDKHFNEELPNVANNQGIGDKCFNNELYGPSKILVMIINNNLKLVLCHTNLQEYRESLATATKNVSTWKAVCFACLTASEFCLVATCGLEVIKYSDLVEQVVIFYSKFEYFIYLISLFEQGLGLEDSQIVLQQVYYYVCRRVNYD